MKIFLSIVVFFLFIHCTRSFGQQPTSPQAFLGYSLGEKFTPVNSIYSYFEAVATANPSTVKIENYGTTYEGRKLLLAFISSKENMDKLEFIRQNNLRLAGLLNDQSAAISANTPAILWLSFNVHGNEPSSSEAAMKLLYALADPNNTETKEWLKNVVVIIDPCLNPDGRERYTNWYRSVSGPTPDANPVAMEHQEPWPQGRTNHYLFDLNRDWAWQTQKETKQRMQKFLQWMPQVHVDFHEQGYNAPYYFAPAAQPYHEVITSWQKQFQAEIGKNNAAYFDKNGWLYFTKEVFDLLYPSYGDTYPMYSGAIGMTFEQGGIGAGLAVVTETGDTLKLADRLEHHYTAALATLETVSENAGRLLSEYKKYFDRSSISNPAYATYVLTAKDPVKLNEVAELLKANGIEFGSDAGTFSGYNYFAGKEEKFQSKGFELAVSAYQPKSRMVQVLFEPKTVINDSMTYDITAWSLPYVYGIDAFAIRQKLPVSGTLSLPPIAAVQSGYGVLIPYENTNAPKFLAYLLAQNIKLRFTEKDFRFKGQAFKAGTLIVLAAGNQKGWLNVLNEGAQKFNIQPVAIESGMMESGADIGSSSYHYIKPPKVALAGGKNASNAEGEISYYFNEVLKYPVTRIDLRTLATAKKDFDVLILPDGNYPELSQTGYIDQLQDFVKNGGKLIAMENAAAQIADLDWGLKKKALQDSAEAGASHYSLLKSYADRNRREIEDFIPGAIFKVQLDNTHPLAYGYPDFYYTLKQSDLLFDFLRSGWNVGVIKKEDYVSGFVGSKLKPKMKDAVLFGVQPYGRGQIVFFADDVLFRMFWKNGELLFSNAIFLVGQ